VLAGLIVITSVALVANTIRLSIFARRRHELVHSLAVRDRGRNRGLLGGLLAVLLLTIAKETLIDPLLEDFALLAAPDTIDFRLLLAALLMLACVVVSALGSGITLRRFLRV
jgi:cell division transport system permease protein